MNTIKIFKSARRLELWQKDGLAGNFIIALGFSPEGGKLRDGDGRTPEGTYYICTKNPVSRFTLFMGISYPNIRDAARGLEEKLISEEEYHLIYESIKDKRRPSWDTPLGGKLGIHGMGNSRDWTAGCIAMEDKDIKWLWDRVALGDAVKIFQ